MVKRIHVTYHLRLTPEKREVALRAHGAHVSACPMARSVGGCIAITTVLEMEDLQEESASHPTL